MAVLLHPGVFTVEKPSGARTIEGVPTSNTIFVGETERGPLDVTLINSRLEYSRLFGGYRRRTAGNPDPASSRLLVPHALDGFFANGGTGAFILRMCDGFDALNNTTAPAAVDDGGNPAQDFLVASSPGAWGNSLQVATALATDAVDANDLDRLRIAVFYTHPGSTTPELVEEFDRLSDDPNDESFILDVLRRSSYIRWDPQATPHIPSARDNVDFGPFPTAADLLDDARPFAPGLGGDGDFALADLPVFLTEQLRSVTEASLMVAASSQLLEASDSDFVNLENAFVNYVNIRPLRDLFFVGELPDLSEATNPVTAAANHATGANGAAQVMATTYNALYWPHIRVPDPAGVGRNPSVVIPPAGYVAGLYAQTDGRRGVWKAPAGTEVLLGGVSDLSFDVLDMHQDSLNPRGVNALRRIPGAGLSIWGARTMRPSSEWRYVPVRRTAIFLRVSIHRSIQWAVFEPNDEQLWQSLRNTIGAFMEIQFRNGAFAGATSRDAYFVRCDATTTTPDDQAAGIVNILVGFAPLRPAEFVVVTLQQIAGQSR